MVDFLTIAFIVVLLGLTLLAIRMWYTTKGQEASEAERKLYGRFLVGLAIFWVVAIAGYFGGPLLSGLK
jgi:uncharacterized membrane protein